MRLKLKQSMLQIHFFRAEIFLPIWSGVEGITACIFSTYYASNLLIRLHLLFFYFSILPPAWLICPFGTNLLGWFWLSIWFLNVLYTEGLFLVSLFPCFCCCSVRMNNTPPFLRFCILKFSPCELDSASPFEGIRSVLIFLYVKCYRSRSHACSFK